MVEKGLIKNKYIKVDKSDSVSTLIGLLKLHKAKAALIFDKKKFLGVADTHLLIRTKQDPAELKAGKIVKRVPVLTGKEPLKEVVRLMFTAETRILPVKEDNIIIGVINAKDIITKLNETEFAKQPLSKIMSLEPITVNENERLGKAIYLMREENISRIPVVNEKGEIVNIIALTDLLFYFVLTQQSKSETKGRGGLTKHGSSTIRAYRDRIEFDGFPVRNLSRTIGTPVMITASPEDTLERTIDKMERFDISSIIVVELKKPVGVVSTRDLLKLFLKDLVTL